MFRPPMVAFLSNDNNTRLVFTSRSQCIQECLYMYVYIILYLCSYYMCMHALLYYMTSCRFAGWQANWAYPHCTFQRVFANEVRLWNAAKRLCGADFSGASSVCDRAETIWACCSYAHSTWKVCCNGKDEWNSKYIIRIEYCPLSW